MPGPISRSGLIIAASLLALLSDGCSRQTKTGPRPKAALGQSGSSQLEFRQLSRTWHAEGASGRQKLESRFREFLAQYPRDALRRPALVYLGWLLIQKGALAEAQELVSEARRGASGVAQDFALVADAALMTLHGRPSEAMKLLRPLQGKIIDPIERFLATEQLVHAAVEAEYHDEALLYSVDWVQQAPERDRQQVRSAVLSLLSRIPQANLERALVTLEPQQADPEREQAPARYGEKQWLYEAVSRRLAGIAVATQDVRLAQKVLTHSPSDARAGDDPEQLVRIATGGESRISFSSRTVGLLLVTETAAGRSRSSEVAGMLNAGLLRQPGAPFEIVLRQDNGTNTPSALRELAASGAAVIIAGLTPDSAERAARNRNEAVPMLLLESVQVSTESAFTIGVSTAEQTLVLAAAANAPPAFQALDCDAAGARAQVADWQRQDASHVTILADAGCALELSEQLTEQRYFPRVLLGLHASALQNKFKKSAKITLQTGHFPVSESPPSDLETFIAKRNRGPTWPEALAHDAALVVGTVLAKLPAKSSSDVATIANSYSRIRAELVKYSGQGLWSSSVGSFNSSRQLSRTLRYTTPP